MNERRWTVNNIFSRVDFCLAVWETLLMKKLTFFLSVTLIVLLLGAGCAPLLTSTPTPSSMVVTMGGASTNDPNLVAYLKAATTLNSSLNPTSTAGPINALLVGLTGVAAAAAGWYTRHVAATKTAAALAAANQAAAVAAAAAAAQNLAAVKAAAPLVKVV